MLRYAYGTWRRSFENNSVYFNVATVSIVMFLRSTPFWDIKDTLDIFSFFFFMTVQVGFRKSVKNGILTRISIAVLWNRARLSYSREPRLRREANLLEGDFLVLNPWNYKRFFHLRESLFRQWSVLLRVGMFLRYKNLSTNNEINKDAPNFPKFSLNFVTWK